MVGKAGRHGKRLDNGARRGADFGHMEQMAGAATEYPTLLGSYGGGKQSGQKSKETLQIDNDTEEGPAASEAMRKAPISMLQEFVQCAKEFRIPSRRPILTWSFETRMEGAATLEFRATATFLLGGVPHHSAGMWHHSKKSAQRDAAERALGFFVGKWGEQLLEQQHPPLMDKSGSVSSALSASSCRSSSDSMWPPPPKAHCILHEPISPLAAHMTYDDATFSSSVYSDSSQDGNRQWSSADTEASHSPRVYVQHHVAHDVQHHVAHQPTDCDILFQACRDLQAIATPSARAAALAASMAVHSSRLAYLLKRFRLPADATQIQLREAYLRQAKALHPDYSGEASGAQFKHLKNEYEEASGLLRGPCQQHEARGPNDCQHGGTRQQNINFYTGGLHGTPRNDEEPLFAEQRWWKFYTQEELRRHVILVSGGVGAFLYTLYDMGQTAAVNNERYAMGMGVAKPK